ncbi:MAG: Ig-like domain-containing protein [Acholeplasmatales bacterium]|nr:MAG: Ig-like domain-containing protein [Acholeplasmatales bacterium]
MTLFLKRIIAITLSLLFISLALACNGGDDPTNGDPTNGDPTNGDPTNGDPGEPIGWDGQSIRWTPAHISLFGSGTPTGFAQHDTINDTAIIWNTDASLDNFGGIQTPMLTVDFSKALVFEMDVVSTYTEYIVKLAVQGELEHFYVLSDSGETGVISVNVVDAMLSDKYRQRNTQPDPGYQHGWHYAGQMRNVSFHILPKGPSGEQQTAELVLRSLSVYNNLEPITQIEVSGASVENGKLEGLLETGPVQLSAQVFPLTGNQDIQWRSANPDVATVDAAGRVTFTGVGRTEIIARSSIDQSKQSVIQVRTLSGYESPIALREALTALEDDDADLLDRFLTLHRTEWGDDITATFDVPPRQAVEARQLEGRLIIENYFSALKSSHIEEALLSEADGVATVEIPFFGGGTVTAHRLIDGVLVRETVEDALGVVYAINHGAWQKHADYVEYGILEYADGTLKKYTIETLDTTLLIDHDPVSMQANWVVPDRTRQLEDPVIHALSPASIRVENQLAIIRQNKYPEALYHFGGLVSPLQQVDSGTVEIQLEVEDINRMNDFVRTMWEIRVIYYETDGNTAVSRHPIKIADGNTPGLHTMRFTPAHTHFRLYFVVNGSDIGGQFPDAEVRLSRLKMYRLP